MKQIELDIDKKFLGELEKKGEFTGERLKVRKPEVYQACINLIASGMGQLGIAKLLKISVNTIGAVRSREQISIESQKRVWADKFRSVAGLSADRAIEKLMDDDQAKDIPLNQLAITAGIFTEKAELLTGGATSRVDWVQPSPAIEDFEKYVAGLEDVTDSTGTENDGAARSLNNGISGRNEETNGRPDSTGTQLDLNSEKQDPRL